MWAYSLFSLLFMVCVSLFYIADLRHVSYMTKIPESALFSIDNNGTVNINKQVADGDKAGEKIARDRDAQRGTVAALSRDIAAVKQREEAASSGSKGKEKKGGKGGGSSSGGSSGGLAQLSEAKAAVRLPLPLALVLIVAVLLWLFWSAADVASTAVKFFEVR